MLKLFRFCAVAIAIAMFGSAVLLLARAMIVGWVPIPTRGYFGSDLRGWGVDFELMAMLTWLLIVAISGVKLCLVAENLKTNGPRETLWGWFVRGIYRFGSRYIVPLSAGPKLVTTLLLFVAIIGGGGVLVALMNETYRCVDQNWAAFAYIFSPLWLFMFDGLFLQGLMSRHYDPWVYNEA